MRGPEPRTAESVRANLGRPALFVNGEAEHGSGFTAITAPWRRAVL
jgi:hypothetical protein